MAKKKKKPRNKKASNPVVSTANVNFASRARRGSVYDKLFARVAKLKPGTSIVVPVPEGITPSRYQNRLNSALRKHSVKPPKGCSWTKRITVEGKIAISCVKH